MLKTLLAFFLVECVITKWCPDNFHFGNDSGTIKSPAPRGGYLYPNKVRCEWSVTIPHNFQHVKLSFRTFDIEDCRKCSCDYVEVFDHVGPRKISLGKFCGNVIPGPFYSSQQTLSVVFKSDDAGGHTGFRASYASVLPGSVCRNASQIVKSAGLITSPGFPNESKYPNNMDCIWKITTPPKTRIRFKINSMSIQSQCGRMGTGDACSCDFLEIRDGNRSSNHLLATLCGDERPADLYSSGPHLWVRFKSDKNGSDSGFMATFSSATIVEGYSCPESWKYPIKCPQDLNPNANQTGACCYNKGPSCCKPGGRRCTDKGAHERDYCPRPNDDGKLKYCCMQNGKPSCCKSSSVRHNLRVILLVGVLAHVCYQVSTFYSGTT